MGVWDRLFDWLSSRSDASAQLPMLPGPVEVGEARADSTWNPFTGLGGWGDKGAVARPNLCAIPLSDRELDSSYRHGGIPRRIVDLLPNEATRRGWDVPEIPATLESELSLYDAICDAGKAAQLHGDAIVLLVTEDDVPPAFRSRPDLWLQEPLDLERVGMVQSLPVFDVWEASPAEWERDVRQPGYRLPRIWNIGADGLNTRVHASRVLLLRGAKRSPGQMRAGWGRSNGLPDDSILQAIWDQVRHLTETHQGGAVLAQELSVNVLKVATLPQKATGDDASAFQTVLRRIAQSIGLLNMVVLGPNDTYEKKATPATGFADLSEAAQAMLSTVLGWPRSMLSGEAPGGLSTDDQSGLERERKVISTYQEQRLRRPLEQLYTVLYASQDGPTGGVVPDEWSLTFRPLNEPSDKEIADLRLVIAQADQINTGIGVYTSADVARSRFGPNGYSTELEPVEPPDEERQGLGAELRGRGGLAALPALIDRGVLTEQTAADLLGLPPPPEPDPSEEAAIAAAHQALQQPPPPGGNAATDPESGAGA
jgi:phage-related protein (TIGR01555 family)